MNCEEITNQIKLITQKKQDFEVTFGREKTDIKKSWELHQEIKKIIKEIQEKIKPETITILGKEFPVETLEIGGKSVEELIKELEAKNIEISESALEMLQNPILQTLPEKRKIRTVRLKMSDLGWHVNPSADQFYAKTQELGLELCPAEVGLFQCLKGNDLLLNHRIYIAMTQIKDWHGDSDVFCLEHREQGLWLVNSWASRIRHPIPDDECMFRIPQAK